MREEGTLRRPKSPQATRFPFARISKDQRAWLNKRSASKIYNHHALLFISMYLLSLILRGE